jgi:hypothetical protein
MLIVKLGQRDYFGHIGWIMASGIVMSWKSGYEYNFGYTTRSRYRNVNAT